MTLGQKLKKLRSDKNLTQKDLADQLHVTFQTISKWENDENEPDISTLKELAKLYKSCCLLVQLLLPFLSLFKLRKKRIHNFGKVSGYIILSYVTCIPNCSTLSDNKLLHLPLF